MKVHRVKIWSEYFPAVLEERKPFEWRKNDRNYQVGDMLILEEWNPETEKYTGNSIRTFITYVAENVFEMTDGYCVLGIKVVGSSWAREGKQ